MLELPESYVISNQLNDALAGKTILNVVAAQSPHKFAFYFGDPGQYHEKLTGKTIDGAHSVAGQVEIVAENARILFSDGANIRFLEPGREVPKKHQLLIELDDFSNLYCTVQMYAVLHVFFDGENDNPYYLQALEKPSPLTDEFDREYFESLYQSAGKNLSVKAFLATEQRIPGLGNGVLQDILFRAGIHPKTKLSSLTPEQLDTLYDSIKDTLLAMAALGGRNTEKDIYGCTGGYETILSAKTLDKPCPVCGGVLVRQAYMGGNVYFCPICQMLI